MTLTVVSVVALLLLCLSFADSDDNWGHGYFRHRHFGHPHFGHGHNRHRHFRHKQHLSHAIRKGIKCSLPRICRAPKKTDQSKDLVPPFDHFFVIVREGLCINYNNPTKFLKKLGLTEKRFKHLKTQAKKFYKTKFGVDFSKAKPKEPNSIELVIPGGMFTPSLVDCIESADTNIVSSLYGTQQAEVKQGYFNVVVTNAEEFNDNLLSEFAKRRDFQNKDIFYYGLNVIDFPYPSPQNHFQKRVELTVAGNTPFRFVAGTISTTAQVSMVTRDGVFEGQQFLYSLLLAPPNAQRRLRASCRIVITLNKQK